MYYFSLHIFISIFKKIIIKKMKINNENLKELENTLNSWNIAKRAIEYLRKITSP